MTLPEAVRSIRSRLKLSQAAFGKLLGLAGPTICSLEKGSSAPSPATALVMLAHAQGDERPLLQLVADRMPVLLQPVETVDRPMVDGEAVRHVRKMLGLEQTELARILDIGHPELSKIETSARGLPPAQAVKLVQLVGDKAKLHEDLEALGLLQKKAALLVQEEAPKKLTPGKALWQLRRSVGLSQSQFNVACGNKAGRQDQGNISGKETGTIKITASNAASYLSVLMKLAIDRGVQLDVKALEVLEDVVTDARSQSRLQQDSVAIYLPSASLAPRFRTYLKALSELAATEMNLVEDEAMLAFVREFLS